MTLAAVARTIVAALAREASDDAGPDGHLLWVVERALAECRWRSLTAAGLARQALRALDSWEASVHRLDAGFPPGCSLPEQSRGGSRGIIPFG